MREEEVRFMWLFVFFDLPVGTKKDRREAGKFRKFLQNDGYDMMQLSVYTGVCRGQDAADKHRDFSIFPRKAASGSFR